MAYQDEVIADTPSAYWRLGEASGTTAVAAVGPNGTYTNAPTLGQASLLPTVTNPSVRFDGTNDFVLVGDTAALDLASPMSVECWFNSDTLPGAGAYRTIVSKQSSWGLEQVGSAVQFWFNYSGGTRTLTVPAGVFVAGVTYHVVVTYDGTNLRIYKNGVEVSTVSPLAATGAVTQNNNSLRIGSYDGSSEFFDGFIDEVALYKSVLSLGRIAAHYSTGTSASNSAPTVNAGADQTVDPNLVDTFTLTATASDSDGTIASYLWEDITGTATTVAGSGASRTISVPRSSTGAARTYRVTVTDNGGATATDTVVVTILPHTRWLKTSGGTVPLRRHAKEG